MAFFIKYLCFNFSSKHCFTALSNIGLLSKHHLLSNVRYYVTSDANQMHFKRFVIVRKAVKLKDGDATTLYVSVSCETFLNVLVKYVNFSSRVIMIMTKVIMMVLLSFLRERKLIGQYSLSNETLSNIHSHMFVLYYFFVLVLILFFSFYFLFLRVKIYVYDALSSTSYCSLCQILLHNLRSTVFQPL